MLAESLGDKESQFSSRVQPLYVDYVVVNGCTPESLWGTCIELIDPTKKMRARKLLG